ncbi:MAG: DUF5678 domain-containing protein [Patescibacteria group bacterium]
MRIDAVKAPLGRFQDKWVALNPGQDKVIASAKTLKLVISRAKKTSYKKPVFMKVLSSSTTISPTCYGV